jgi:hypothetical protein
MPTLHSFVSHLPKDLLTDFLERRGIRLLQPELQGKHRDVAGAIRRELALLPYGALGNFDQEVARIELLSTEAGEIAIRSVTVHDHLSEMQSRHARALWVYLNDEDGFRRAEESRLSDVKRGGREWTAFVGKKLCQVAADDVALKSFKDALRLLFECNHVHVEMFQRSRPEFCPDTGGTKDAHLTQITIYRDAPPNTELAFSPEGELGTEVRRTVVEASVTYDEANGQIECVSRQTDNRQNIASLVATKLLGCPPDFEPASARAYDLSPLRQKLVFDTEPVDQIEAVRVASLRLNPIDTLLENVTVESRPTNPRDIWAVAGERLGQYALETAYEIVQAKIVVRYRSTDSNRVRSLPIVISHPNRSNLKEHLPIERVVANKYLPRWGLVVAPPDGQ